MRIIRDLFCSVFLAILVTPAGAQIAGVKPPFLQCPPIGASKSCKSLITVNLDGSINIDTDPAVIAIDAASTSRVDLADDALFGVQNNSGVAVDTLVLTGFGDESTRFDGIFHFDLGQAGGETSIVCVPKSTANCVTGYEGPGVSFNNISADFRSGTVLFNPPLQPGKSAYFALENNGLNGAVNVSALSFTVITNGTLSTHALGVGSPNQVSFTASLKINVPQGNWLTFNASPFNQGNTTFSGTTPASINVSVDPAGLPPGVYPNAATIALQTFTPQGAAPALLSVPVNLTVLPQLSITSPCPAAAGVVGSAFTLALVASGGTQPYTWILALGPLPPGLLLNPATGVISGIPQTAGSYPIQVTALDSGAGAAQQKATYSCTIVIGAGVTITTNALPSGFTGVGYSATLVANGGTPPYLWTVTGTLPPGLTLNPLTGVISGTPSTAAGSPFNFSATVKDSQGSLSPAVALSINIAPQTTGNPPLVTTVSGGATNLISPGAIGNIFGANLGPQASVLIDGIPNEVLFSRPDFIVFKISTQLKPGPATLVVQRGGLSSAGFSITLNLFSPVIFGIGFDPNDFFQTSPGVIANRANPVSPGDRIYFNATGLGPVIPPPPPVLSIDGQVVPIAFQTVYPLIIGDPSALPTQIPAFYFDIPFGLKPGTHSVTIQVGGFTSNVARLNLVSAGIVLSQTGLTFRTVAGQPPPPTQTFTVLSGAGLLNFSISTSTLPEGLSWLSATPGGGTAQASQPGVPVQVQVDPSGLAPGTYFGFVQISSPDALNSPQIVVVVLDVSAPGVDPGPQLSKTGLVFAASPGGTDPSPQTLSVTNIAAETVTIATTLVNAGPKNPFTIQVSTGNLTAGQTAIITVKASSVGLAAGVYAATLKISFSDGTMKNVGLLFIVAPGAASSASSIRAASSACSPTRLLPLFTQLEDGFNSVAGFPTTIEVKIVDDCASPMLSGTVSVSFSNADPTLYLTNQHNGSWITTWAAINPRPAGISVNLQAQQQEAKLQGSAQVTGGVQPNPSVPVVNRGGVVESAGYSVQPAPGSLISIFGGKLSAGTGGATQLPLSTLLLSTKALVAGRELPLVFTSDGQVNAILPYDLPLDNKLQLFVRNANSSSLGEYFSLAAARPGVFTIDNSGKGQGQIYKAESATKQTLADKASPAKAGDVLVVYCSGLGAVDPPVTAGTATPITVLTSTVNPVTAKISGRPATVAFAGLTPGFTGLYQVNLTVPDGLPDNDATTLVLSVAGQDSPLATLSIHM